MIDMTEPYRAPEPPQADKDWFGGRRWTGIAALAVILLIIVLVAFLIANRHHASPKAATPTTGQASSAAGSLSNAPSADQAVPTAAPAGISWSLYQSVALPSSPTAGPAHVSGDIATGYAHTPVGALVALAQTATRNLLALDSDYRQAVEAMVAPGPGRDAWLAQRSQVKHPTPDPAGTYTQIVGFNYVSYTPTDAVIQIATRASDGTLQALTEHVTWLAGDWKLVLAPNGGDSTNSQTIQTLQGFVAWGGA